MTIEVKTEAIPNMPWEDRASNCSDTVWRHSKNPVIDRNPIKCAERIFNSAVIPFEGKFVGVFRADHRQGGAQLHFGRSDDALSWDIDEEKLEFDISPAGRVTGNEYGYDPRLIKVEDCYYILWCNGNHGPTIGIAKTKDFKTFVQLENAFLPCNRNGVLFPRKINGNFVMLNRPSDTGHTPFGDIWLSESPDLCYWGKHRFVRGAGGSWWNSLKIGPGPAPIETSEGWLTFYHGVCKTCNGYVYRMSTMLLDIDNPSEIIADSAAYMLGPEKDYETVGFVPNVVFPCATLCDGATGRIAIYYGAADTKTCIAYTTVNDVIDYIKDNQQ